MPDEDDEDDEDHERDGVRGAVLRVAAVGAVLTVVAGFMYDAHTGLSVGIGAALATANLWGLGRIIRSILATPDREGGGEGGGEGEEPPRRQERQDTPSSRGAVVGVLKMVALFAGIWLLLKLGVALPLPLVVGYASLPLGICLTTITRR